MNRSLNYSRMPGPGDLADTDIDDAEDARAEWIDERAKSLVAERMKDYARVSEAIADMDDEAGTVTEALALFVTAWEAEPARSASDTFAGFGARLWRTMYPLVEARLRDDAEADAEKEYDRDGGVE